MRPDEHKRKKNAQYKKKHGISDKGVASDSKSKSDENRRKENKATPVPSVHAEPKPEKVSQNQGAENVEFDEEKKYRRRHIESNWSRYDDSSDSEDDLPEQRGEDFNKLLAEAGGSAAQFRFKDEEEWGEEKGETTTPLLALDFENLAESLSCIPLHERLGIADHLFTKEQITEMEKAATENETNYRLHMNENTEKYIDSKIQKFQPEVKSEKINALPDKHQARTDAMPVKKSTSVQTSNLLEKSGNKYNATDNWDTSLNIKTNGELEQFQENSLKSSHRTESSKSKDVQSLEDDLDLILSLEEHTDLEVKNKLHVIGVDETGKTLSKSSETTTSSKKAESSKGTENLEDWLDTMLDD